MAGFCVLWHDCWQNNGNASTQPMNYLDFRADIVRYHTKHNCKGESSQKQHAIQQNWSLQLSHIKKIDSFRIRILSRQLV